MHKAIEWGVANSETRVTPRHERATLITRLNEQLGAIKRGQMPGDGREEIIERRRALQAEQAAANRIARRPY